ncbi:uncharacterized protein RMCC_0007, partial [Mycolicibacterium canariasense]
MRAFLMRDLPTCGAVAVFGGRRLKIQFGGADWVAVTPPAGSHIPDGLERVESSRADPEP